MTLTEFLIARVEEDEAVAQAANGEQWIMSDGDETVRFLARHDPARVLAECAALRAVVQQAERASGFWDFWDGEQGQPNLEPDPGGAILRALAAVYADHPDYRPEEWA